MKEEYKIYQIDAFADSLFKGNPAAVVPWKGEWPSDSLLLQLAAENNLSETAFYRPNGKSGEFDLRWFTPGVEVDLCGHATLASAFVIYELEEGAETLPTSLRFHTKSGILQVFKEKGIYYLDFPSRAPVVLDQSVKDFGECFGKLPKQVLAARDIVFLFEKESDVQDLVPNFEKIKELPYFAAIVTAPADPGKPYDFVSRFFAPAKGVPEDPVTGSAHCTLIPYWSERLGKKNLKAYQTSKRGGHLLCEDLGERVRIGGTCKLYMKGNFYLE
ncbi:PhzF family phenazine biosynthesis protein [Leptospira langatensis]|uniref:PhzF family phenazine biosynthesis protein n=1 Tax=Leptospira langatensis TaxID=2484983 RepID=A0A5F1ZVC4_9LEPT|nr:PhzF family phenazine biosynthesis protein [Leptospira langatensis]TGK03042.1 PhzF family phenazine biosynthesis protein [Leptospira langatensis]TGL41798.1 PhzF family phenazine biosynthesis protein [Leptospira langatensis]